FDSFSQNNLESENVASISYKSKKNLAVYSFEPLSELDEFKTAQRITRFNSITDDNIIVEYKENKIFIKLNSDLTKDINLNSLLEAIVKIHGYSTYHIEI